VWLFGRGRAGGGTWGCGCLVEAGLEGVAGGGRDKKVERDEGNEGMNCLCAWCALCCCTLLLCTERPSLA